MLRQDTPEVFNIPNPDPAWHYAWVPRDPAYLSPYLFNGYRLVTAEEGKKLFGEEPVKSLLDSTGHIVYGDLILAKLPSQEYERRVEEFDEMNRITLSSVEDTVRGRISTIGNRYIDAFVTERDEYLERKQWNEREGRPFVGQVGRRR